MGLRYAPMDGLDIGSGAYMLWLLCIWSATDLDLWCLVYRELKLIILSRLVMNTSITYTIVPLTLTSTFIFFFFSCLKFNLKSLKSSSDTRLLLFKVLQMFSGTNTSIFMWTTSGWLDLFILVRYFAELNCIISDLWNVECLLMLMETYLDFYFHHVLRAIFNFWSFGANNCFSCFNNFKLSDFVHSSLSLYYTSVDSMASISCWLQPNKILPVS